MTVLRDRVLLAVPRVAVVALTIIGIPLALGIAFAAYNPIRFPEHAGHLRPLRHGLLADRFGGFPRSRPGEGVDG